VAAIDIGSNTSLLLIASLSDGPGQTPDILEDQLFFTRLAEGFSKEKKIQNTALERQDIFFKKARKILEQYSVKQVKCVATAAAREAQNSHQLIAIGKQHGFSIDIISAEEEARISRKGALFQLPVNDKSVVVLDIGGASTEISKAQQFFSLPIGSVNLTERFLHSDPPKECEILSLMKKIKSEIKLIPFPLSKDLTLVATAGTPTTLAALKKKREKLDELHGEKLSVEQVHLWWEYLFNLSVEKRKDLKGMPFYRADVMPAGLSILKQVMHQFQWDECIVSITGLRYGLLCQF
jgi:exopolyphosphatase/guanosine-5'-triphosphate,3'-diphosphate pyrophosphatase